jgi:hypothetical protein
MIKINSLSGGKTSSYIAVNYPADYNLFSLVRTNDKKCLFPDKKVRQIVSDRLGVDFIGTLEEDMIIYTMLDLEQYLGTKINWVTGKPFEEILKRGKKLYLPNATQRFCTTELKLIPMFEWWERNINEVVEMRIGYRANELSRVKTIQGNLNENGYLTLKRIIGKRKTQNKWADIPWQKPSFPLVEDNIYKDNIEVFWQDKNVRFAYLNNCVGCFHRSPVLLKHMSNKHENKFNWFMSKEQQGYKTRTFKNGMTYREIKNSFTQIGLFDDDFNECDSGYCGI